MNRVQYQLLSMLAHQDRTTEEIYSYLPDLSEAHIIRRLGLMAREGLCLQVGTYKRDPGSAGRSMHVYGITAEGTQALEAEDKLIANMRGESK